ncbi:MAG: UbiA family prenyltransferase [Pirellulales bacterium]|nr:UbiA family prenyltransferase [Pirellulales bacterium]
MNDSRTLKERLFAVAQLMRLANVFTAIADVWMGYILMMGSLQPTLLVLGFTVCSCLLYTAGVVLNDAMDARVDAVERPERPIPSDRVSLRFAYYLGWNLLFAGMLVGFVMSIACRKAAPGLIAWVLGVTIVAYNSSLKKTWLGPIALAVCRMANVLLGMSPWFVQFGMFDFLLVDVPLAPALGIGCYVCGIAWFAKEEHTTSRLGPLWLGVLLIACGFLLIASAPWWEFSASSLRVAGWQWIALWSLLAGSVLFRCLAALQQRIPSQVQRAVGYGILMIIPIDATLCWGYAGWEWACAVLALLVPARLLSRWLRVT